MDVLNQEIAKLEALQGAKFLHAYLECSDEIQAGVRDMLSILCDVKADASEREMAAYTLADALFPNFHEGQLGMGLAQSEEMAAVYSDEARDTLEELDKEEVAFSDRLQAIMTKTGITQCQLAQLTGVSQPAISNMLNRQCRPQRRTLARLAEALKVEITDLWPHFS